MASDLGIVIINVNLKDDTVACIKSMLHAGASIEEIIVIDNGSNDGSARLFAQEFGPSLDITASPENVGFARGCNLGIRRAQEKGAEWVLFINNDTVVDAEFLKNLTQVARQNPEFDLFGPLILLFSQPGVVWYLGDRLIPGTLITTNPYRRKEERHNFPLLLPVDFLNGCCLLVSRRVLEKVGGFDPRFYMYGEDVEFCWRARQAGFRLAAVPGARIWHKVSTSSNKVPAQTRYLRILNQIRFYRTYARGLQLPLMLAFTALRMLVLAAGDLSRRQVELIRPLALAWLKGWFAPERPEDQVYGATHT
jgi:GT2 family glycosyltransferase